LGAKRWRGTKLGGGGVHGWEEDGHQKLETDERLWQERIWYYDGG
jgi:hypothetical protein